MRVFVAGATGAIGLRLLPRLVAAGHTVVGTTRRAEKISFIESSGARAVIMDGLDMHSVTRAVAEAAPDVIVHEMTDLAGTSDLRHFDRTFEMSNRLRTEGTDHLLAAARQSGVKRFVAQSFCGWPYARNGALVKVETDPLDPAPPREFRRTLEAIRYLERVVAEASPLEGVVLRYGVFYGPATGMCDPAAIAQIRRRLMPLIGDGEGRWSFIHVDDAAAATAIAIERGSPGVYNIVDDEPAPVREWLPVLAAASGAKPPRHVPAWLGRFLAGEHLVAMMTENRAGSNAKAKAALGWSPAHSSWRQGFAEILTQNKAKQASEARAA